ncbi:MAG: aminotransferase class IV, partial [Phycisphaeraceae bacterium]
CEPTVLAIAYPVGPMNLEETPASWRVCLDEDRRWTECWIKSLMLLPNVLARQAAREAGCQEVILHRDGRVTEGSAANVFIVRGGELVTHPADRWILSGITRNLLIELARAEGVTVREEPFTTDELLAADEIFFTGTTTHLAAAVEVDGQTIGEGTPGPVTRQLHRIFVDHVARTCGLR